MYSGQRVRILQKQIYMHRSTFKISYLEDSKFTSWNDIFIKTLLLFLLFVQYISTIYIRPINHHYKSEINDTTIITTQL